MVRSSDMKPLAAARAASKSSVAIMMSTSPNAGFSASTGALLLRRVPSGGTIST